MRYAFVLAMGLLCSTTNAQFGARFFFNMNQPSEWENILMSVPTPKGTDLFNQGWEASIDYWFRMKNYRLEFFPEVSYGTQKTSFSTIEENSRYRLNKYSFSVNSHIYFLDFFGDCDCPTFSKQGGFLQKGLFLMARPGIAYLDKEVSYNGQTNDHSGPAFQMAVGLGFDLGITNLLTLSPLIQFNYIPSADWSGFSATHGIIHVAPPDESSSISQLMFGIRIGFRPDYRE